MDYMNVALVLIASIAIPWVVQLIKTRAIGGKASLILAVAMSILGSVITGLAAGIPADPSSWASFIILVVISAQGFYGLFKSAGVTNKWLDALLAIEIKIGLNGGGQS